MESVGFEGCCQAQIIYGLGGAHGYRVAVSQEAFEQELYDEMQNRQVSVMITVVGQGAAERQLRDAGCSEMKIGDRFTVWSMAPVAYREMAARIVAAREAAAEARRVAQEAARIAREARNINFPSTDDVRKVMESVPKTMGRRNRVAVFQAVERAYGVQLPDPADYAHWRSPEVRRAVVDRLNRV